MQETDSNTVYWVINTTFEQGHVFLFARQTMTRNPVRTGNAGQSLKQAVQASSNPELKTRYITCIADGDANAMDIQYHKACWTKHVFHVLRDDTNQAPKTQQSPTQVSSFVELLNIIDTQTRDGAYLSIQDIENTIHLPSPGNG